MSRLYQSSPTGSTRKLTVQNIFLLYIYHYSFYIFIEHNHSFANTIDLSAAGISSSSKIISRDKRLIRYICEFTCIEHTFRYRVIIGKYFLSIPYIVFTICYAEHIVAYHYHLHIQDSIYINRYFLTRTYICTFHKRNHGYNFFRDQSHVTWRRTCACPHNTRIMLCMTRPQDSVAFERIICSSAG